MRNTLAILALVVGLGFAPAAFAQTDAAAGRPDALAQMELSDALIKQYIEAQPDVEALMNQSSDQTADAPDPKVMAKLQDIAKKHKFANFGQMEAVAGNIALVLQGMDPKTKKYIGAEKELKQEIADLKADASISPDDKKSELAELQDELKNITLVKFNTNIDLVTKFYDQLAQDDKAAK